MDDIKKRVADKYEDFTNKCADQWKLAAEKVQSVKNRAGSAADATARTAHESKEAVVNKCHDASSLAKERLRAAKTCADTTLESIVETAKGGKDVVSEQTSKAKGSVLDKWESLRSNTSTERDHPPTTAVEEGRTPILSKAESLANSLKRNLGIGKPAEGPTKPDQDNAN